MLSKKITLQDIEEIFNKLDIIDRPYLIYCHPSVKEQLLTAIGNTQMIEEIPWMEPEKLIVIDRAKWEEERRKFFEGFIDYKKIGESDAV